MPIYEYQCKKCNTISEFLEGVTSEKVKKVCSSCGGAELEKVFSTMNFTIGGSKPASKCQDICGKSAPGGMPPCGGCPAS
ncbi:MAG: zinc ribbon domain-containing protein [Candidatus Omnitrophota bacterium]